MKQKETAQRQRALELAISQIEKQYGKGSIQKLGSREIPRIPSISTGSINECLASVAKRITVLGDEFQDFADTIVICAPK